MTADEANDAAPTTAEGPTSAARAFVHAIVWGEHTAIWELLSDEGRSTALGVALRRGLDRVVAGRIRDDLADPAEREEFLSQLVIGLRRDLRSVDLDQLTVADRHTIRSEGGVAVELLSPSNLPGTDAWCAGLLVLSTDLEGHWRVDRLEPRLAGP